MHLGGRRCALPPNPPPALFSFKLPPLTAKHLPRTTFQTKTQDAKDTQSRLPPLTAKHLPRATLQTRTQEQNYQCKGFSCFKVASSHSQIPSKNNIPNKNTRRRSIESTGTEKCGQDLAKGARNWKRERGNRKKDGKWKRERGTCTRAPEKKRRRKGKRESGNWKRTTPGNMMCFEVTFHDDSVGLRAQRELAKKTHITSNTTFLGVCSTTLHLFWKKYSE